MKQKLRCSVCGSDYHVIRYKGITPYCNKHYLRLSINGSLELQGKKNTNTHKVENNLLIITTKKGEQIIADAADFEKLSKHSWCISKTGYAVATINRKVTKLHRFLLELKDPKEIVDHINGDKLDNRRSNLRICDQKHNSYNCKVSKNNKVGVLGISMTACGKYQARIQVERKEIRLGNFDNIDDAIKARQKAEIKYFGDFAPCLSAIGVFDYAEYRTETDAENKSTASDV